MSDTPTPPEPPTNRRSETESTTAQTERFAHLADSVTVKPPPRRTWAISGLIVAIAIGAIGWAMLRHHAPRHHETLAEVLPMSDNEDALEANNRRLAALRHHTPASAWHPSDHSTVSSAKPTPAVPDKALLARRNAPTQMYNTTATVPRGTAAVGGTSGKVLVGHGTSANFVNGQSKQVATVTATTIAHPNTTIAQGEFLHATLETAINSDLPGMVRAVVTRPVYGYTGQTPLIPAGSRLIGQYASLANNGAATERVLVVWNRVITPQGLSLMINSPGTDALGQAGSGADAVDHHFVQIFGTATLLSIMSATTATAGVGDYDQPNSANQYRQSVASALQQSAQTMLNQNLSIRPTLHIDQGRAINVFVAHDLDCTPVMAASS